MGGRLSSQFSVGRRRRRMSSDEREAAADENVESRERSVTPGSPYNEANSDDDHDESTMAHLLSALIRRL